MNRKHFDYYMNKEPENPESAILFLVDDIDIATNILICKYGAIALQEDETHFLSVTDFVEELRRLDGTGSCMTSYTYVAACRTKKINERLEQCFEDLYLKYWSGWQLFYEKEYLGRMENQEELKKILDDFRLRFEQILEEQPQLAQFHKFNSKGEPTDVYDMRIVTYLMKKVHFFVIGETPYIYENGVYREDNGGYLLKDKIRELMYADVIRNPVVNRIYELLISLSEAHIKLTDINNQPRHWINFENGFYDPIQNVLIEHDPKYRTVNQIPYRYEPDQREKILKGGSKIREFLEFAVPDEMDQEMFWEYFGSSESIGQHYGLLI